MHAMNLSWKTCTGNTLEAFTVRNNLNFSPSKSRFYHPILGSAPSLYQTSATKMAKQSKMDKKREKEEKGGKNRGSKRQKKKKKKVHAHRFVHADPCTMTFRECKQNLSLVGIVYCVYFRFRLGYYRSIQ